jgi:hypothetical protein
MKGYGQVDVLIKVFLTLAIVGGVWSASRPCILTPLPPKKERPVPIG